MQVPHSTVKNVRVARVQEPHQPSTCKPLRDAERSVAGICALAAMPSYQLNLEGDNGAVVTRLDQNISSHHLTTGGPVVKNMPLQ